MSTVPPDRAAIRRQASEVGRVLAAELSRPCNTGRGVRTLIELTDGTRLTVRLAADRLRELVERSAVGRVGLETEEYGFRFITISEIVRVEQL